MILELQSEVRLEGVAQIAFSVPSLVEAKTFYGDVLGMTFLFDAGSMAFFQCGAVRVMVGEAEKAVVSEGTIVYFRVADLEGTARLLRERGVSFVQEPHLVARMKSHDLWLAFLKDPGGNTLGLMSEVGRSCGDGESSHT